MPILPQPSPKTLFFSKNDPQDPRLGDFAQNADTVESVKTDDWAILGYADDEGIRMNGGRPGAAAAPDTVRKYFYKMTPPRVPSPRFYDFGNITPTETLEGRHRAAQALVQTTLSRGLRIFTLGGGHDYGFPDAAGFIESLSPSSPKPLIVNFDAHLDVRPVDKGFHSGTPFYRLLTQYKSRVDFIEVGIQPQCNSPHHRTWAEAQGASVLSLRSVERVGIIEALQETISAQAGKSAERPLWISLDIDAFCSREAPGCSQSFATGLEVRPFLAALEYLQSQFSLRGIGIYEVSPPLDQDDRTSKLAALIMHYAVFRQSDTET